MRTSPTVLYAPQEHERRVRWAGFDHPSFRRLYFCYTTNDQTGRCGRLLFLLIRLADTDASRDLKNFIGSTKGGLTRFLGIPFAKPPYVSMLVRLYRVLTLV